MDSQPDSADVFGSSDDGPCGPTGPELPAPPEPKEQMIEAKRNSIAQELVKQLYLRHLRHQLQQDFPGRQAAAQLLEELREFKRRHTTASARNLQTGDRTRLLVVGPLPRHTAACHLRGTAANGGPPLGQHGALYSCAPCAFSGFWLVRQPSADTAVDPQAQ